LVTGLFVNLVVEDFGGVMTEVERIRDQLRRAYEGDAWCGSSLREALSGVTAERAARRPVRDAHTIWELVLHVAAWNGAVRRRLEGEPVREPAEGDFPPVTDASEAAWAGALETLAESHRRLQGAIARLDDSRLEEPVVEGMSSAYVTLHGVVQHGLYHAAQISLLKKA
jgi:uncharacterized damage-inducible protein DinB